MWTVSSSLSSHGAARHEEYVHLNDELQKIKSMLQENNRMLRQIIRTLNDNSADNNNSDNTPVKTSTNYSEIYNEIWNNKN